MKKVTTIVATGDYVKTTVTIRVETHFGNGLTRGEFNDKSEAQVDRIFKALNEQIAVQRIELK